MGLIKQVRRKNRITSLELQVKRLQQIAEICGTACQLYAFSGNWKQSDETKDVKNEAGLVVGLDRVHYWMGSGSGPELAKLALAKAGIPGLKIEDMKV